MNGPETARAAWEWHQFQGTDAYRREERADRERRDKLTLSQGHLTTCGILICDPRCKRSGESGR